MFPMSRRYSISPSVDHSSLWAKCIAAAVWFGLLMKLNHPLRRSAAHCGAKLQTRPQIKQNVTLELCLKCRVSRKRGQMDNSVGRSMGIALQILIYFTA